jgi:L-cysteine S-thiosulfotransferase
MRLHILTRALILSFVGLSGCQTGFSLPNGDEAMGKAAFVKYRCADCHTIVGMDDLRQGFEPLMTLPLGGRTEYVKTYEELVTSIINPSHVISPNFAGKDVSVGGGSKMPNYNHAMSVNELIDLVTFLEGQYELEPHRESDYENYVYPPNW